METMTPCPLRKWVNEALAVTAWNRKPKAILMTQPFADAFIQEFDDPDFPPGFRNVSITQYQGIPVKVVDGSSSVARVI